MTGLEASARLYLELGFTLTEEKAPAEMWGKRLAEQRYDLSL